MAQAAQTRITPADIATGFAKIGCRLEVFGNRISYPMVHAAKDDARWLALASAVKRLPNGRRDLVDYLRVVPGLH